jgi:hypothetical protein
VYRNYRVSKFGGHKEYSMMRCTSIEAFEAYLDNLEANETKIVISVLENLLDKAVTSEDKKEMAEEISAAINGYFGIVEAAAKANPGTTFVLIDPILRPKLEWYDQAYDMIKETHKEGANKIGLINISRVDVISRASQQFEQDGVHLTAASGKIFVSGILDEAEKIFKATFVDLGDLDESGEGTSNDASVVARIEKLETDTAERKWNDNLLFARTREELDTAANKLKEDRIIMTGLTSRAPPPADRQKRKEWMKNLVIDTIKKFKSDFDGRIIFINQGKNNGKEIPMAEVKLSSVESATAIRKAFAEKRKENDGKALGKLYVANSVNLATRVRIDILKAIAKKITNTKESAHVASYSSRPILHVKTNQTRGEPISRAYTFIDAVIKFGKSLVYEDLGEAYRRAGTAFRGQMEQHYVVLREEVAGSRSFEPKGTEPNPAKRWPNSGKRGRENEGDGAGSTSTSKNQRR